MSGAGGEGAAALGLWRAATRIATPLLPLWLARRARLGKEEAGRLGERRGEGAARPQGPLLWVHAASVGESLSVLPLLETLAGRRPDLSVLMTTGTVTSARLLAARAPLGPRLRHRYLPLDAPAPAERFLEGWRPDAALFVEGEVWPNLLDALDRRGVPRALVNARVSARTARAWRLAPGLARRLFGGFRPALARSETDAARLRALGAPHALCLGDLKFAAPPLPADPAVLAALRSAVGGRPVWLAASTHPGEEALAAAAHDRLAARLPGLLTLIAPRHPERGAAVTREIAGPGRVVARRGAGEEPGPGVSLYVADTLGELGLFYRLAGAALVGGSLVPRGGQNPLEPARLGCPVLLGPHTGNFEEAVSRLLAAGGALRVADAPDVSARPAAARRSAPSAGEPRRDPDADALAEAVAAVLTDGPRAARLAEAAARVAAEAGTVSGRVAEALHPLLPARVWGGSRD